MMRKTVLLLLSAILLSACDRKGQMVKLAEMSLRQGVDYPGHLKILAVSEPDSAFGTHYFSRDEGGVVRYHGANGEHDQVRPE